MNIFSGCLNAGATCEGCSLPSTLQTQQLAQLKIDFCTDLVQTAPWEGGVLVNIITHFVKVVVEVYIGSTEVASKEGGVSREYGCHVNPEHSQQDKSHPCQPLVEVRYNQWSRTWDTFPELRGEEERGKEERGEEERGGGGKGSTNKETRDGLHESHHANTNSKFSLGKQLL